MRALKGIRDNQRDTEGSGCRRWRRRKPKADPREGVLVGRYQVIPMNA